ncbi:MAG: cytochrome c [Flavobacteriia bacterium]|jgi:mono/diheme cytochrome c family protein|uniref:c-type cytochrome n=1 Tax=Flavobacterium sp. TaxID=239 RepID=UPI0029768193|nr:MAG: cytochrome c [Flavobacteriia bacterium]
MKSLYKIVAVVGLSFMATSCFDKAKPNYQFFPNMYEAVSYETYSEHDVFKGGVEAQVPAKGSIKRGFVPYEIPNTPEGYALAKATLKSPLNPTTINQDKAKDLYTVYCAICHGEKGDGKGNLVVKEKFLGVPNYKDREITDGSIFHVITYGLNSMGSHANQLSQEERWMVADYVLKLKAGL